MSIYRLLEARSLPFEIADYESWPKVDERAIDKKKHKARFLKLRECIKLYCGGERSLRNIETLTGVAASSIKYFVGRALELHDDGRINGERALVRYQVRIEHVASAEEPDGYACRFKALLKRFPELKKLMKKMRFKQGNTVHDIHSEVKDYLYEKGFSDDDYPLNTDSQGEWAVWKYLKSLESKHFREIALSLGGKDAARRADVSSAIRYNFRVNRPYQRIELDAHTLHAIFVIDIVELDGTVRTVELKRLSILAAIDTDSRAILGYRISMNMQPTVEDVALTLAHVLDPLADSATDILGYATGIGSGLPAALVERCRFRSFDELALDNALAHTSPALHDAMINKINCVVNLGKSAHPEGRPLIEGFFKVLNRYVCRPLPSTTGSDPRSSDRRNPSEKAKRYKISYYDLEKLVASVISGYNATTHSYHGRTPNEQITHRITHSPGLIRRLRPEDRSLDFLFKRSYKATIAGSVVRGERPYVQFKRAKYRNQMLSSMGAMIGKAVTLIVDIRDLRFIEALLPSGESIGIMHAQGGWSMTPHSLQTRRAVNRHLNRTRVRGRIGDYVRWYVANLAANPDRPTRDNNIITRINLEIERGQAKDVEARTNLGAARATKTFSGWLNIGPEADGNDGFLE